MDQEVLKNLHKNELEILQEVVRICEENNLTYFLIGGTLLGAIRHKGFIPWDDDLDIAMPREDYNKFLLISIKNLNKKYYLHCNKTDPNYWLPFAKIRKENTVFDEKNSSHIDSHKGIYVDIFPLDNANKEKSLFQVLQAYITKKLSVVILWKMGFYKKEISLSLKIILRIMNCVKLIKLSTFQQFIMSLNKNYQSKYFVNLGSNYNYIKQTIPKNKYYPPVKVEFEGKYYNAPNDWDYILKRIYGDYMKLPPVEKRITHNPVRIKFEEGEEITF